MAGTSWEQELFELEQERRDLQARIDRAQSASPEEWNEMRGTLGSATDSLQAGVRKLRAEVSQALALNSEPPPPQGSQTAAMPGSGLCAVEVPGVEAKVAEQDNRVTVTVTTDEDQSVPELQRRASELAKSTESYAATQAAQARPGHSTSQPHDVTKGEPQKTETPKRAAPEATDTTKEGDADRIDVQIIVQNLQDGAKLTFTPKHGKSETLKARLERDAARLAQGTCGSSGVSMNTTQQK